MGRVIAWGGTTDLNSTWSNARLLSTKRGSGSLESIEALSELLQTKRVTLNERKSIERTRNDSGEIRSSKEKKELIQNAYIVQKLA